MITPPLSPFAPTQPELSAFDVDTEALLTDVAEYVEADALQQRQNDAVLHDAPALDGIRKGDNVRVQTSNPCIPFVGRVAKLLWDGRVCVKQGDVCYWTTLGRVAVLSRVEG